MEVGRRGAVDGHGERLRIAGPPVAVPVRRDGRRFPGEPASVPAVRRHVRAVLHRWGRPDLDESGALLATELATNAVLHASGDVGVELLDGPGGVVVLVVADASPALPVPRSYGRESSTGRGLWLMDHFSSERGVELVTGGKRVWAVLCPEEHRPDEGADSRLATRLDELEGLG